MIYKSLICRSLMALFLLTSILPSQAQEVDVDAGKTLFRNQCATCHNKNMKDDLTGPALGGTQERWADYPREDLYSWIRNSQALIAEGHPRAQELWAEWGVAMNPFPNLTDAEIENLLGYIQCMYDGSCVPGGPTVTGGPVAEVPKKDNTALYIILAIILAGLALILARIVANLNYMIQLKEGDSQPKRRTLVEILTSKGVIGFVIFALIVILGYTTVNNAISLGRQQGYQPEQPIKFSHVTHAGIHKIECQYCHDGARRSKHSVIPAANTCMNCHKAIEVGSTYGTAELTKIFASIGYDPSTDVYLEDYDNMSQEDVAKVYKKWIADSYLQSDNAKPERVEEVVNEQWDAIVEALTDEATGDYKVQGPIEWVRIHNLPDHAYFNHAQHVSVGKVECQQCHGPVEEMEVVAQYSPLSMGWCINCHRRTEVKFADNEYYQAYSRYHEEIANGERTGVTVEEIGGLECQKCHY